MISSRESDLGAVDLTDQPQMFLDDLCVATTVNLVRQVQQPLKCEHNPVLVKEHPWEGYRIEHPVVVHDADRKRFRMYYTAFSDATRLRDVGGTICVAESDDGLRWTRPMLDIRRHDGASTNIVLTGALEAAYMHVIKAPDARETPYKGVYLQRNPPGRRGLSGLFTTQSRDGLHWTAARRITATKCDTMPSLAWCPPQRRYFVYTRAQAHHPLLEGHLRMTGILSSDDFEHWNDKVGVNLLTEADGWPRTQVHALTATAYADLLVGQVPLFHLEREDDNMHARCDVHLAVSRDGWHWKLVGDRALIPHGPAAWERSYVHSGSVVVSDDLMHFHYTGMRFSHRRNMEEQRDDSGRRWDWAVGAATLPAERFVALVQREPGREGILETPPVRCEGTNLLVNADGDPGDLEVELVDEKGHATQHQSGPIPGFERDHCRLVRHDALRYRVVWRRDGSDRSIADARSGQPFVLRFILRRGRLFAFRFTRLADDG
ncbi:MAG: hypothetical protein CMJ18_20300 [Phycisphaeraceae bacterium]|nr:hypothetical protein [Phycisphaeraceae bacterium]